MIFVWKFIRFLKKKIKKKQKSPSLLGKKSFHQKVSFELKESA